ncbi:MAG TPA: serine/threonine-protein kinase [Gemmatimonadales bacterium]|nr:serine/threonine-protein kinase [Gemmatimonadales bacterium]
MPGAACIVGPMSALLERAREALAPAYRVEVALGAGGMGEVFRATDVQLERAVAVKVLRPEAATAVAVERFVREARLLARLSHPHIVPVYQAGESQGLYYFVMELQAGETLARRLERGPLPAGESLAIAHQLLAALVAAHGADVIHRDVKPSNIFLAPGGARLGDFGIAHSESDPGLTRTGDALGTVAYMAPEQRAGLPSTARTDLYAVGAVVYECLTGRRWVETQGDWSRVPGRVAPVLRRALEHDPAARWPDARAFASALDGAALLPDEPAAAAGSRHAWLTAGAILLLPALAIVLTILFGRNDGDAAAEIAAAPAGTAETPGPPVVAVASFVADASDPAGAVERQFRRRLAEAGVPLAADSAAGTADLTLSASVDRADGELAVRLGARGGRGDIRDLHVERRGALSRPEALGDSLAADALLELWRYENTDSLPRGALPGRFGALIAWAAAERHFARAEWGDAEQAYAKAMREDPDCLLCEWRLQLIARWYQSYVGPERVRHLAARADAFPDPFRSLIRATGQPFPARIDSLDAVRDRFPGDHLAQFLLGDELMHRGPLAGLPRRTAAEALAKAAALRPRFLPAFEHAAWLEIADGDATLAQQALVRYVAGLNDDPFALSIAALLRSALTWRFAGPGPGRALFDTLLSHPAIRQSPLVGTAPRFLVSFGAPDGALELAGRFLADPAFAAHRSAATWGRAFAFSAQGRLDSAVAAFGSLADPAEAARWRALLPAAFVVADRGDPEAARLAAGHRSQLLALAGDPRAPAGLRGQAAMLLALTDGAPEQAPAGPARLLAEAEAMARAGDPAGALAHIEGLHGVEASTGPFLRALLHLRRGDWRAALGDAEGARREWVWHENQDVEGTLLGGPVSAEVDWALGTLARWRRAEAARPAAELREDACRDYAEVARLWRGGNPTARARADSARAARRALACGPA